MPTRSELEARYAVLQRQADAFRQQYNMTLGAIAECEYWLSRTVQETPPPKEDENG